MGTAHVKSIRFETEAPVDDILIETDPIGYLFVQTKTALTSGKKADSEARKDSGHCNLLNACQSAILNIELRRPLSNLEPGKFENIWR